MFQSIPQVLAVYSTSFWIAQTAAAPTLDTPLEVAQVSSAPQFFMASIAGVILAFAFQLLLTNLSLAAGISYLGHESDSDNEGNPGSSASKIGGKLGFWTLVTVSIALGAATLLAVKFSLISSEFSGAVVGLVIWGTFFCLLFWVGSTTVGSLIGTLVKTATSGFQSLAGTASSAIGAKAASSQVVSTVEASVAAVRRELAASLDPEDLRETVQDYLGKLQPQELDIKGIRGQLEKLFQDGDLKEMVASGNLPNLDRETFVNLVKDRTDFSKQDINRIAEQMEDVWKQFSSQMPQSARLTEFTNYLKSADAGELRNEFNNKLNQLISDFRSSSSDEKPSLMERAGQLGLGALASIVMNRTDLSDFDVEKIVSQLQGAGDRLTAQADKVASQVGGKTQQAFNTIRADVENYLNSAYSWQMKPEKIAEDFKNVIYDPEADPRKVRRQIEQLSRSDLVKQLSARGVFTQEKIEEIANQLEKVRKEVLETVSAGEEKEQAQDLRSRVENYLRKTGKEELNPEGIWRDFKKLLEDPNAGVEQLRDRFSQFDRDTVVQLLAQREDFSQEEAEQRVAEIEGVRDRVLSEAQEFADKANAQLTALRQKVEDYLRNTGKEELNPDAIKQDLKRLLDDPQAGLQAIRGRLSDFDRDTLVQLLSQRPDFSEEEANQLIDRVESVWKSILHAPQNLADKSKEQYERATEAIAEYLRNTGKESLNPDGIKQDLAQLLEDPKEGALALRDRLSHIDRDTLVKLVSQRGDLSEEEVNQIVDRVQDSISSIVKAPRRLAKRVQTQVQDFGTTLEDYLRNTGKEELNPDALKRDLQQLLNDPKAGAQTLGDRLSHFDRSTIVALLSQREDISEEEANKIVDQILSVRDQFAEQVQKVQDRIQGASEAVVGKIRNYLNALNRPELNYEGITGDIRKLFEDPEAGVDALRDRLGQFDRDTLVAVLSSREDISEADANRIVDRIDKVRYSVLDRAERLQKKVQDRMEKIKHQAMHQAEETREAVETAAWWIFGTALTSALVSAIAGVIGVSGFSSF